MVSGIPNIINSLSEDLKSRIEAVVQLTEDLEVLKAKLEIAKRDLRRVHIALEALNGSEIPIPLPIQDSPSSTSSDEAEPEPRVPRAEQIPVQAAVVPEDPRPICNSCGSGRMNYTSRTLNNGKVVTLWLCSECRNERF